MELHERIKAAREHAGLSQAQLGELVGLSQKAISKLETRGTKETPKIVKIAIACGVRPEWLDDESGPMISFYPAYEDRINHILKVMEQLPPYALDYAVRSIDQTAELISGKSTLKEDLECNHNAHADH